jgi:hypothetical protein
MTEEEAQKALDFIRHEAPSYAKAKAERTYIEQFLRSKKSLLMSQEGGTLGAKEAFAYAHPDYIALLAGLREAVEVEETLRWKMEAAKLFFEKWKVEQFNNRVEARAMN